MGKDAVKLSLPDVETDCSASIIKTAAWMCELLDRPVKLIDIPEQDPSA